MDDGGDCPLRRVLAERRAIFAKVPVEAEPTPREKTLSELTQQYDAHPHQITGWKDQLLDGADGVFGAENTEPAATPST